MPTGKLSAGLLLRGSAALVLMLLLWWLVLVNPLSFLLRQSTAIGMLVLLDSDSKQPLSVDAAGNWAFHVPLEMSAQSEARGSQARYVHFVDFAIQPAQLNRFTFSVPLLWALLLSSPGLRRCLRPLLVGTFLVFGTEVLSLLVFVDFTAHLTALQKLQLAPGFTDWLMSVGLYTTVGVIPFVAPFLVAIALHRDLRNEILRWDTGGPLPEAIAGDSSLPAKSHDSHNREKRRGRAGTERRRRV